MSQNYLVVYYYCSIQGCDEMTTSNQRCSICIKKGYNIDVCLFCNDGGYGMHGRHHVCSLSIHYGCKGGCLYDVKKSDINVDKKCCKCCLAKKPEEYGAHPNHHTCIRKSSMCKGECLNKL